MRKYDNVIFDLDGTLLNTKVGIVSSLIEMTSNLNLSQIPECDYNRFIGPPIEQSVREYYGFDELQTREAAMMFRKIYAEKHLFDAVPYENILDTLAKLKDSGLNLAIATYKRHDYAEKAIKYFGLDKYCNPYIGSDTDSRTTKTAIILACISKMNANVLRTVYIGDTEHDRIGAKEANIDFIGVTYGFGYNKNSRLEYSVDSPEKIINLILGEDNNNDLRLHTS